jgi:hypothetical protein
MILIMPNALTTLIDLPNPLNPDCLHIHWNPTSIVTSSEVAEYIESRWATYAAEAHAAGKTLFNGLITRLISARAKARNHEAHIVLTLGPADYKTFLVSCLRDHDWFQKNAPTAIALALGNSALLTHGSRALLGIRSEKVSAYPGRAHLFGGVAELLNTEKFPATAAGLVAHLELELHEEAGIGPAELSPAGPRLVGLAQDNVLHQPELFWQWETAVELEQLVERLDAAEHSGFLILDKKEIASVSWERLTPVARHVVQQWAGQSAPAF